MYSRTIISIQMNYITCSFSQVTSPGCNYNFGRNGAQNYVWQSNNNQNGIALGTCVQICDSKFKNGHTHRRRCFDMDLYRNILQYPWDIGYSCNKQTCFVQFYFIGFRDLPPASSILHLSSQVHAYI